MESFDGLDREQVKAVIEFAARSLDKPLSLPPRRECGFSSIRQHRYPSARF
jgi:hypothetical protein